MLTQQIAERNNNIAVINFLFKANTSLKYDYTSMLNRFLELKTRNRTLISVKDVPQVTTVQFIQEVIKSLDSKNTTWKLIEILRKNYFKFSSENKEKIDEIFENLISDVQHLIIALVINIVHDTINFNVKFF